MVHSFSDFIKGTNAITMQLKIEDKPWKVLPETQSEDERNRRISITPYIYEVPPVFSHMNFMLMETLSATQHGEFVTRSKQLKYETIVELGGHISHRYGLSQQELAQINNIYDKVLEMWIVWRLANRKN